MNAITNVIKINIEANQETKLEEIDVSFCGLTDNDVIGLSIRKKVFRFRK